jgi:uncharacterized protein (TIGR04255 family)
MAAQRIISFQKPPIVERYLAVQFDPLPNFTNAHLGVFWSAMGIDIWPRADDHPPLPQLFERFGDQRKWEPVGTVSIAMSQKPQGRARLTNAAGDRIVQIQNGKLVYHWVGVSAQTYPRYELIRAEMVEVYNTFSRFVEKNGLGEVHLNQWEVSYSNTLPQGTVWNDPADWSKVFGSNAMLPPAVGENRLEQFSGSWVYEIPAHRGRLHIKVNSGKDRPEGTDVLALQLTARGPIADGADGLSDALSGLDTGHEMIVTGFHDLTSVEARKYWGEEAT